MKKTIAIIGLAAILSALCLLAGCRSASHNGKLDGNWRVVSIENTATGEPQSPGQKLFYSFYRDLVQLRCYAGAGALITGIMSYDKGDGDISFRFPNETELNDPSRLAVYGIYSNPVTFEIVKLTGKELVIRSEQSVISMERF